MNLSRVFSMFFKRNFSRIFGYSGDEDRFLFPALPFPLVFLLGEGDKLKKGLEVARKYCPAKRISLLYSIGKAGG